MPQAKPAHQRLLPEPACWLFLSLWLGAMPGLVPSRSCPVAFPLLVPHPQASLSAFHPLSPGDWHSLVGEEELKGVSMATPGPAPYGSV